MAKTQKSTAQRAKKSVRKASKKATRKSSRVKAPKKKASKARKAVRKAPKKTSKTKTVKKSSKTKTPKKAVSKKTTPKKSASKKSASKKVVRRSVKRRTPRKAPRKAAKSARKAVRSSKKKSAAAKRARSAPKKRSKSKGKSRLLASLQTEVTFAEYKEDPNLKTPVSKKKTKSKPKKAASGLRSSARVSRPPVTFVNYDVEDTPSPKRQSKRIKQRGVKRKLNETPKRNAKKSKKVKSPKKRVGKKLKRTPKKVVINEVSESESEPEYEVEQIIDMEMHHGREMFRVKWKGYSNKHNTWEPRENLTGCEGALDAFLDSFGYEVEYICGSRTIHGKKQYKVKWLGYPSSENTWEPASNLQDSATDAIVQFESRLNANKKKMSSKKKASSSTKKAASTKKATLKKKAKSSKIPPRRKKTGKRSMRRSKTQAPFTRSRARSRDSQEVRRKAPAK